MSASLFRRKNLATFKSSHSASSIAQSSACHSPRQNPHNGKNELAGGTPTEGSNRRTPTPATTHAPTPTIAPVVAPFVISGFVKSFVVRYSKNNLQRILKTVLNSRPPVPVPAPIVAGAPHYEGLCERPLKTRFPDIYQGKTHLEC